MRGLADLAVAAGVRAGDLAGQHQVDPCAHIFPCFDRNPAADGGCEFADEVKTERVAGGYAVGRKEDGPGFGWHAGSIVGDGKNGGGSRGVGSCGGFGGQRGCGGFRGKRVCGALSRPTDMAIGHVGDGVDGVGGQIPQDRFQKIIVCIDRQLRRTFEPEAAPVVIRIELAHFGKKLRDVDETRLRREMAHLLFAP